MSWDPWNLRFGIGSPPALHGCGCSPPWRLDLRSHHESDTAWLHLVATPSELDGDMADPTKKHGVHAWNPKKTFINGCFNWMIPNLYIGNIFYFHPYLGKWSNLTHIFRMGWNHQLEKHGVRGNLRDYENHENPLVSLNKGPRLWGPAISWAGGVALGGRYLRLPWGVG